jgi:hypothetical protein
MEIMPNVGNNPLDVVYIHGGITIYPIPLHPIVSIHVDRVMAVLKFCFPLGGVALESGGPVVAFGSSLLTAGSCRVAM